MEDWGLAFCENGECRVVLFRPGSEREQNCPACGRMGRLKAAKDHPEG